MKTNFLLLSLTIFTLLISGCKKDNEPAVTKPDSEGDCFTAKIDGVDFNFEGEDGMSNQISITDGFFDLTYQ